MYVPTPDRRPESWIAGRGPAGAAPSRGDDWPGRVPASTGCLLAYQDGEPVGWIAVAPRSELTRVIRSRTTPPVDGAPVWVIPCITVRKAHRGRGIAVALIRAAVDYASEHGAAEVEAYPRADGVRTADGNAFFGTEPLFRRAGFKVVREPLQDRPRNWLPRVAMRISTSQPAMPGAS